MKIEKEDEKVNPKLLLAYKTMVKVAIRIIEERRVKEKAQQK